MMMDDDGCQIEASSCHISDISFEASTYHRLSDHWILHHLNRTHLVHDIVSDEGLSTGGGRHNLDIGGGVPFGSFNPVRIYVPLCGQ